MPAGYKVDSGLAYASRGNGLTYGWDSADGPGIDRNLSNSPDQRYDTFVYLQNNGTNHTWQMAVPNGTYQVHVVAGDPLWYGTYKVNVEGKLAINATPSGNTHWAEATVTVTVTDGKLTLSPASGAVNTKIDYIDVTSVGTPTPTPTPTPSVSINWQAGPASPNTRVEAGSVVVGSKLYIFGGFINGLNVDNTTDIFDASTGTWTQGDDFPGAETHASYATDGVRYIYKAGGQLGDGIPGTATADVWQFDTLSGDWTSLPDLPEARYTGGMVLIGDKLYHFGGDKPDRTTVTTNLWVLDLDNLDAGWVSKASMPFGGDHMSAEVIDGKIYSIGGEHGHATKEPDNGTYVQHKYLLRYDPDTNVWTRLADLPVGRSHAEGSTQVINGKIVLMGGKLDATHVATEVDVYDPATNKWTTATPLPRAIQGGDSIYYGGKLYVTDGQAGGSAWTFWNNTWVGTLTGI